MKQLLRCSVIIEEADGKIHVVPFKLEADIADLDAAVQAAARGAQWAIASYQGLTAI